MKPTHCPTLWVGRRQPGRCHYYEQVCSEEVGEKEKQRGSLLCREIGLETKWWWGPGWCEWAALSSEHTAKSRFILLPRAVSGFVILFWLRARLMSMFHWRPCPRSVLNLETMLILWAVVPPKAILVWVASVATWGQVDVHSPGCLFWLCGPTAAQVSAVPRKQVEAHDSCTPDYKEQRCNLCSDMNDCVCRVEREGYAKLLWQPLLL